MLSIVAWLFFVPGAALMAIPMVAICNGVYTGDQAMSAVLGLMVAAPGFLLVLIDTLRAGWSKARVGVWGLAVLFAPVVIGFVVAGFCELTGVCTTPQHLVEED